MGNENCTPRERSTRSSAGARSDHLGKLGRAEPTRPPRSAAAMARGVPPTAGGPRKTMFSLRSTKPSSGSESTCSRGIDGWKLKANLARVGIAGSRLAAGPPGAARWPPRRGALRPPPRSARRRELPGRPASPDRRAGRRGTRGGWRGSRPPLPGAGQTRSGDGVRPPPSSRPSRRRADGIGSNRSSRDPPTKSRNHASRPRITTGIVGLSSQRPRVAPKRGLSSGSYRRDVTESRPLGEPLEPLLVAPPKRPRQEPEAAPFPSPPTPFSLGLPARLELASAGWASRFHGCTGAGSGPRACLPTLRCPPIPVPGPHTQSNGPRPRTDTPGC